MTTLNLTFDEPTDDERVRLNPQLQVAELLGAKNLDLRGIPVRVLAYRYRDGYMVFSCRTEQPRSVFVKSISEQFIATGFEHEDQFWTILLSYMPPLA